jgi:hypothetical protein
LHSISPIRIPQTTVRVPAAARNSAVGGCFVRFSCWGRCCRCYHTTGRGKDTSHAVSQAGCLVVNALPKHLVHTLCCIPERWGSNAIFRCCPTRSLDWNRGCSLFWCIRKVKGIHVALWHPAAMMYGHCISKFILDGNGGSLVHNKGRRVWPLLQ